MKVIVPVTGEPTVQALIAMKDRLGAGDWITVNSGGIDKVAEPDKVQARAERLAAAFPQCTIHAFTSGMANLQSLSSSLHAPVKGIFYDYEPNYPNLPEFSFDTGVTLQNLSKAAAVARGRGLQLISYLTGRGLFNPGHQWNYSAFQGAADGLVIQTQSALKNGKWPPALDLISQQFPGPKPPVQITVAPGLPNTVDLPTAYAAFDELVRRGFSMVEIWWVPPGAAELQAMLDHRKATGQT
jgi:hypothetical protein